MDEDLATKFKDPDDPLRLAFVCAMWMTGFDVPSCSTLYLDKPMRNHTLMQAIARANRVYPGKVNGLIVDYVGVFRNLEKALAIYGSGGSDTAKPGDHPVADKAALVDALKHSIDQVSELCTGQSIDLVAIQSADGFDRIKLLDDAVDALVGADDLKKRFLSRAAEVRRMYKAVLPDPAAKTLTSTCVLIRVLAKKIASLSPPTDISEVMRDVEDLLDRSIAAEGYVIPDETDESAAVDLSGIDFDALKERFSKGRKHMEAERMKAAVGRKVRELVRLNRTRMDFLERFQQMIDDYNSGSVNVEDFFRRLMKFAQTLNEEEQRSVGERLSEEELAVYDLLTKPAIDLTTKERAKVKRTAKALLKTLKHEKLVLDWRKRQQSRAQVKVAIESVLDDGLPDAYTPEIYQLKSDAVFQHVYESYFGAELSVYTAAA